MNGLKTKGKLELSSFGKMITRLKTLYRIIKMNSTFYRVFGSVRMENPQKWTEKWAMKNMFAGVPQVGAEEGWYLTQIAFDTFRL